MIVMYENFSQFLNFGDQWCSKISANVHNQFFLDVLKDWQTLIKIQQPQNDCELLRNCIWYNSQVSKNKKYNININILNYYITLL